MMKIKNVIFNWNICCCGLYGGVIYAYVINWDLMHFTYEFFNIPLQVLVIYIWFNALQEYWLRRKD